MQEIKLLPNKIQELLAANPDLKLQMVAHSIGIDRHKIENTIRDCYGCTFREFKNEFRLKQVIEVLEKEPDTRIKELAADIGLTPNALSRFIKSMTGRSARELRRQKW
ncbi:MAG: AraC family transcriptional regulator [Acidobacteria bacterium]|nr:AraC family transcriptional regulator [Acidobacteriota bacterium]